MYHKRSDKVAVFELCHKKGNIKGKVNNIRVFLSGSPTESTIDRFVKSVNKNGITDVFCFCSLKYNPDILQNTKVNFHHLEFTDGSIPTVNIIEKFNLLIDNILLRDEMDVNLSNLAEYKYNYKTLFHNIYMHCNAGLGRAPVMLAYLMISRFDWDKTTCISNIRKNRKKSINRKQLEWIYDTNIKKIKIKKSDSCCLM